MDTSNTYLFHMPAEDLVQELIAQQLKLNVFATGRGLTGRWAKAYNLYYGRVYSHDQQVPGLGQTGQQGEYLTYNANHAKSLVTQLMSIIAGSKPAFNAMSESPDMTAQQSARIADQVIEHIFSTRNVFQEAKKALELSLIFGTSFMYTTWETDRNLIGMDGEDSPVYAGDLNTKALSVYDIILTPFIERWEEHSWIAVRKFENRFDLARMYPDKAEQIVNTEQPPDLTYFDPFYLKDSPHVYVYYAYHKESPALPEGRFVKYLGDGTILEDVLRNPYGDALPVICLRPSITFGSCYGFTPLFDMIPCQELLTMLDSSIASNQRAFAMQNIAVPRGSNISCDQLSGALQMVEYDANGDLPNGGLPVPLSMLATPAEVFQFRESVKSDMEQIAQISPVNRGEVPSGVSSGTALAILSSQSLVSNSGLESQYINMLEQLATQIVKVTSRYMSEDELLAVSGKTAASPISSFKGMDLKAVKHIKVDLGNALQRSFAGKSDLADKLLNSGLLTHPAQYFDILQNGDITSVYDNLGSEDAYIRYENEKLLQGEVIEVCYLDNPTLHIMTHKTLIHKPDVRNNQAILKAVMDHILEHQDQLDTMSVQNPTLLQLIDSGKAIAPQPLASTRTAQPATLGGSGPQSSPTPTPQTKDSGDASKGLVEGKAKEAMNTAENLIDKTSQGK
jgi:hypothetical protein